MCNEPILFYKTTDNYIMTNIGDDSILTPNNGDKAILLNEMSYEILNILKEKKSTSQLIEIISSKFNINKANVTKDILNFLNEMVRLSVLDTIN